MKVRVVGVQLIGHGKELAAFQHLRESIFGGELHWQKEYLEKWSVSRSRASNGMTAVVVAISRGRVVGGVRVDRCVHPFPQESVLIDHLPPRKSGLHLVPQGILSSLCVSEPFRGLTTQDAIGTTARCSTFLMLEALSWLRDHDCAQCLAVTNTQLLDWFKNWELNPIGMAFSWVGPHSQYRIVRGSVKRAIGAARSFMGPPTHRRTINP